MTKPIFTEPSQLASVQAANIGYCRQFGEAVALSTNDERWTNLLETYWTGRVGGLNSYGHLFTVDEVGLARADVKAALNAGRDIGLKKIR